uniref:Uncharacterized protein n=1 Tax=Meloidogyne enterolobii TaxID=390850 RepID=A0A6V7W0Y6_MELEN|nr:unnamed protein product [Meloidogyne enterolobii]
MASVTFFVRFVAIVLLVVSIVYCDVVGHGKHELVNGKIVKLRGNTKIAEKPEDLELYKNMPAPVMLRWIGTEICKTIWYLKNSITAKEGCSIDFAIAELIVQESEFFMEFGIKHDKELTDCLTDMSFTKWLSFNPAAMTSNSLAIAFGLKNGEFEGIKRGYPERHKNYCGDLSKCHDKGGRCLDVADYTVGWARDEDKLVHSTYHPIGDTNYGYCDIKKEKYNKHEAAVLHFYDKEFRGCGNSTPAYFCVKNENVRNPKKWRIMDRDYTHSYFNYLFTFHILPTTSMQMSMQNIWIKCNEDANKENCNENAAFQKCDKMYIKFYHFIYKVLVPDNSVKQTTTQETTTMATCPPVVECKAAGTCPPTVECPPCGNGCPTASFPKAVTNTIQPDNSTEKGEIKPQNGSSLPGVPSTSKPSTPANDCYNEGTKKDSKKTLQITLVIVGSIILLLMFTALLICLFVSKSK